MRIGLRRALAGVSLALAAGAAGADVLVVDTDLVPSATMVSP